MAVKLTDEFGSRANPSSAAYPNGSLKDETDPGVSNDGSPLSSRVGNDFQGFMQSALTEAGIDANGNPDSVDNPQILNALKKVVKKDSSGGLNLISNADFSIAGSVANPPDATSRSYNAGDELFAGIKAVGAISGVTYIGGKLNGTGQLYVDVYKSEKEKLSTVPLVASIASSDGVPVESGASFVDSGDYWRVTFDMNDTFSVKLEVGSNATIHQLISQKINEPMYFDSISRLSAGMLSVGGIVFLSKILDASPLLETSFKVVGSNPGDLFPLGPNHDIGNGKYLEILGDVHVEHLGAGGSIDSGPAIANYINYKISKNGYDGTDGSTYQVMHVTQGTDKQFLIGSEVAISNPKCRGLRLKLKCAAIAPIDSSSQLFRFTSGTGGNEKVRDVLFEGSGLECMRLTNGVRWESCSTKGLKDSTCKGFVFFGSKTIGSGVETIMRGNEFAEFRFLEPGYNDRANMKGTAIDMDDSSGDVTDNKVFENIIIYTGTGIKGTSQNNLVSQNHIYGGNDAIICDSALWQITNNQFDSMTVRINGTERVKIVNNTWNHSASRTDDLDAIVIAPTVDKAFLQGVVIKNNNFDNRSASATMDAVAYDTTNGYIDKDKVNDSYITENYYKGLQAKKYRTEHQMSSFKSNVNTQTIDFDSYLPSWASIKNMQWSWEISSDAKNIFLNVESLADRKVKIDYFDTSNNPVNANVNVFVRVDCYNGNV